MVASLRGVEVDGKKPLLDKAYFVAPNAAIFGDVSLEAGVFPISPVFSMVRDDTAGREKRNRDRKEDSGARQRPDQGGLRADQDRE